MPTERSTSRGRPSKRSARSTSASRKVKPQKFSPQQQKKPSPPSSLRKSKSPQKSIPKEKARKTRSSSRTRKISTAPPAVSARKKKEKAGSRPSSPQSYTTTIKTTTLTATRGPPRPATASPLPYTNALRGSLSPPTLRSRTSAAITSNQRGITHSPSQPRKTLKRKLSHFEQIKNSAFSRQLGKFGNSIKKRTFVIFNKFKTNWRYLFILFFLLLLIGIFYKFNKQLIQLNKQFVEFVQEQYVQQRHIFGEVLIKFKNVSEFVWNEYIIFLLNKKEINTSTKTTISPKIKISTTTPTTILKSTTLLEEVFNNEDEF